MDGTTVCFYTVEFRLLLVDYCLTGIKYGISGKHMETLVFDILIRWKWLGTNHKQVL